MKRLVKTILRKLPFGLGESVVLPTIIAVMNFKPWKTWKANHIYRQEAKNIQRAIDAGINDYILVFDDYVSPPTFGDYIYFLMVGRYLMACGAKLNIFIITSAEKNSSFAPILSSGPVQSFFTDRLDFARLILSSKSANISCLSWAQYQDVAPNNSDKFHMIFSKFIKERKPIYNNCFNLLNALLEKSSQETLEKVLLKSSDLFLNRIALAPKLRDGYIAFACRHNPHWRERSNLREQEFYEIGRLLANRFPDLPILIVSDEIGCTYFRTLADKFGFNFEYSNNISPGFIGSFELVLKSSLLIQLNGGGIFTAGLFSRLPYFVNQPVIHERMCSEKRLAYWATKMQIFINSPELSVDDLDKYISEF